MFINPKAKTNWNRAGAGSVGGGGKERFRTFRTTSVIDKR